MKVLITGPAKAALKAIFEYYRSEGYGTYATKLTQVIMTKTKSLSNNYQRGQKEEVLKHLQKGHRYLIAKKHYKIIYRTEAESVIVTDIFDTRQQPEKLINRNK
ncbi:type II toxin-antitoxin system RelE/ParE family toxin [Roseivirga echinicomitans]